MINQIADENFHKGRGAQFNPKNSFLNTTYIKEYAEAIDDWEIEKTSTAYIVDHSKTLVNKVTSPDVGMLYSVNPYQGCEHGCIYCYARNSHEFWGYSSGIDFESKIVVKKNAPALLRKFFNQRNWIATPLSLSGNTDCYQPIERKMGITRALLEVCLEYRNPVTLLTKNALILRDLDILIELSRLNLVKVTTSITSLNEKLRTLMEPRTSTYNSRLNIITTLSANNIPVGIMNAPIIPGLNDMHIHDVLQASANAGALWAGYIIIRLNGSIADLFKDWLFKTFPDKATKIWNQISDCHGGQVHDSRFGNRMTGEGKFAELIKDQFKMYCRKYHLNEKEITLDTTKFRVKGDKQISLF